MEAVSPRDESRQPVISDSRKKVELPKVSLYNRLAAYPILGTPMGLLRIIYGVFKAIMGILVAPFQCSFKFSKDGIKHIARGFVETFSFATFSLLFKKNFNDSVQMYADNATQRRAFAAWKAVKPARLEDELFGYDKRVRKHQRSHSFDATTAKQHQQQQRLQQQRHEPFAVDNAAVEDFAFIDQNEEI